MTADEAKAAVAEARRKLDEAKAAEKAARLAERKRRHEEAARRNAALRQSLEAEHGTTGHPKADALWSKAWEHGHSSGESGIRCWYADLAELVLP